MRYDPAGLLISTMACYPPHPVFPGAITARTIQARVTHAAGDRLVV